MSAPERKSRSDIVGGVRNSHPDRIIYTDPETSKLGRGSGEVSDLLGKQRLTETMMKAVHLFEPRLAFLKKTTSEDTPMMLIREVFYCKPGKVRPMVDKFLAMSAIQEKAALPRFRVMTDFAGERYWTIVIEMEVKNMQDFEEMMSGKGMTEEMGKQFEELMKGYHDLIDHGRREIYKIEGT